MFTLYHEPYENHTGRPIGTLSTHKDGDGAIYVTERSCAALNSKAERHISERFCANFGAAWTGIRTVAEMSKAGGLEPTETEVNIEEWGWDLVYQTLPTNRSKTAPHDVLLRMRVKDLFQSQVVAVHTILDSFPCRHEIFSVLMNVRLLLFIKIERVYSLQSTGQGFDIFLGLNASRVLFRKPLRSRRVYFSGKQWIALPFPLLCQHPRQKPHHQ